MPKAAPTASSLTLHTFRVTGLDASGGSPFPRRLVICPPGNSDARGRGKVIVSADTFDGLSDRQGKMKLGMRLALDAEHCTVEGTPAYLAAKEPRAVLAWATLTGSVEEGVVYDNLEPTPLGLEAWANQQYQDISPAVFRRADGTVLAIHSAALCRHGEIDGLTITAAAAGPRLAPFFAALSANSSTPSDSMKPTPELIALLTALGITLAADADESTMTAALKDAMDKVKDTAKTEAAEPNEPAAMSAINTQLTTLSAEVKKLGDERDGLQRAELMRQAAADGKVIPLSAEILKVTPLAVLTEIVSKAPAGAVPLGRTTPKTELDPAAKLTALKADAAAVETFSRFGLTPEDIAKLAPDCV